ncbi:hypothetical protein MKW92_042644 [Papaver armeniacum]|nr:hypothetical protein MKW92_042644 [Papaver armeniacum]
MGSIGIIDEDQMMKTMKMNGPVVVTGAAGYVGSWLVMRLLQLGYTVRATVRDPTNIQKTKHLLAIPEAKERLTLWKADLDDEGSFDGVTSGSIGVFHLATPMDFESTDPENEILKPTLRGVLNVMKSCKKAETVKRVIFTTSAGTVNVEEHQKPVYNESSWSDLDFIRTTKMTGWMYFVSKTLAEKAAQEFAEENNIHFISVIPTLVVGPFLMNSMPPSMLTALALITGNEAHYSILKQIQLVHLDDLCNAHIFLWENPKAEGRYICSSEDTTIYQLANMLRNRYPDYYIPTKFDGIDESIEPVRFSSKKLTDLGFQYKYTWEDMFDGAIQSCKEKNLLPILDGVSPELVNKKMKLPTSLAPPPPPQLKPAVLE